MKKIIAQILIAVLFISATIVSITITTSSSEITSGRDWWIETVDSQGAVGMFTSLALDSNDYPYISYYDASWTNLKYAKWDGSEWNIETVDSDGKVGWYTSLALDSNDYPHISYYDDDNDDLKYAKWTGSEWEIETIDSAGDVGTRTSIALDSNDYPHISYRDSDNGNLKHAKWDGSGWNTGIVDSQISAIRSTSIAVDSNDDSHISYYDYGNKDLKYAKWNGSGWDIEIVDSEGNVGGSASIMLDSNDYPHISYCDSTNLGAVDLKYANWDGSEWNIETVDSEGSIGTYISIVLDSNDNPHISYYDHDNIDLKYANWDGSEWNIETVDSEGSIGTSTSIAVDSNDYPHISYRDVDNNNLKYAKQIDNDPPEIPSQPEGETIGELGIEYSYTTNTVTDPDSDPVEYLFDWGDGTDSGWVRLPYASHKWEHSGIYLIKVKSRDSNNLESAWSDNLIVQIIYEEPEKKGWFYGIVYGTTGVIEDAKVCAISSDEESICFFTGGDGTYVISVSPGIHTVETSKEGYETNTQYNVNVGENEAFGLDFILEESTEDESELSSDENEALVESTIQTAIKAGNVAVKFSIHSDKETPETEIYLDDYDIEIIPTTDIISYTVSAEDKPGAFFIAYIGKELISSPENIRVKYDGVNISKMSIETLLNPQGNNTEGFMILSVVEGYYVAVYAPHFSEHTISIYSIAEKIVHYTEYVIIAAITVIIIAAIFMFRKSKEDQL